MKDKQENQSIVDYGVIVAANLFNLIMVGIFYTRTRGVSHPMIVGYIWVVLILFLVAVSINNLRAKRDWWFSVFPLLFTVFLVMEVVLDYILQHDFRNTGLLAPYLILYYLSSLGMIGYSFLADKKRGAVTLVTYFLSQIAAIYSYIQIGHG
jgi:hypothetical protein